MQKHTAGPKADGVAHLFLAPTSVAPSGVQSWRIEVSCDVDACQQVLQLQEVQAHQELELGCE